MPYKPPAPCTQPGCGELVYGGGRCIAHRTVTRRASDRARGTFHQRGYGRAHAKRFRPGVLRRDPYCRCDLTACSHGGGPCLEATTDADHYPLSRRELVARGMDPDDPAHGRGLCHACHSRSTGQREGGFGRRPHD